MGIDRLDNLFHPKSIAVVGASTRPGSVGRAVMQNLIDAGFSGSVYPVNDRHPSIMGKKSYAAVNQIGEPVDLVILTTPMKRERGFRSIWGTVLAENKGMLALGRKLGFTIKRSDSAGELDLNLEISRPPSPS